MSNRPDISFEMLYVDWIKADDSDVQTDIRFSELCAQQVFPGGFREDFFETIERFKKWKDIVLIRTLSRRKTAFVDTSN